MKKKADKVDPHDIHRKLSRIVSEQVISTLQGTGQYSEDSLQGIFDSLMDGLGLKEPHHLIHMMKETKGWD